MRFRHLLLATLSTGALLFAAGAPAQAATRDADLACYNIQQSPLGGVCIFYNYGFNLGAFTVYGFGLADPNLNDNTFDHGAGEAGYGQVVGNNAGQITNHSNYYLQVCTGVNYTGACALVAPHNNIHGTSVKDVESFRYAG